MKAIIFVLPFVAKQPVVRNLSSRISLEASYLRNFLNNIRWMLPKHLVRTCAVHVPWWCCQREDPPSSTTWAESRAARRPPSVPAFPPRREDADFHTPGHSRGPRHQGHWYDTHTRYEFYICTCLRFFGFRAAFKSSCMFFACINLSVGSFLYCFIFLPPASQSFGVFGYVALSLISLIA